MTEIIGKILKIFADNGLFDGGIELIGSWCFKLYQKHMNIPSFPLTTPDIDFLIPRPYKGKGHLDFVDQLEALGFRIDFNSDGSIYLWNADLKIEFLVPEKGRGDDGSIRVKGLGFNAIPLRFVSLLLDDPISLNESGMKIRVPRPANFCLHKLLIAPERKKRDKRLKDLEQAIRVSVILDEKEIRELYKSLPGSWRKTILKELNKAKADLPHLAKEAEALEFTLQSV